MENDAKKIFILEDEIDLNEMIAIELENKGYETNTFYNPKSFIEVFTEKKPDLLITDLRLPEISGTEIIKMVKKIDVNIPPIITITAYNDVPSQVLYNLGAEAVIYKPFQLHLLTSTIERLCIPIEKRLQLSTEKYEQSTCWIRKLQENEIEEINIGRGGFSFSSEEKIENDEVIEFSVIIDKQKEIFLSGLGIIRWNIMNMKEKKEKIINKYGVEFVYLDDNSKNFILSLIYNNIIIPYIPYKEDKKM